MRRIIAVVVLAALPACEAKPSRETSEARSRPLTAAAEPATAPPTAAAPVSAVQASSGLTLVSDRNQVCMVNDTYMGREQIPVTVSDKTYYGCCPMCKGRLEKDATVRASKDPVTGREVDKATAVIGRAPSGSVLYFESERTLAQYKL